MTPPVNKPRVFIASSVEQLRLAGHIQELLEHHTEPTLWNQGIFKPSEQSLESLTRALRDFDAAVCVLAPDDVAKIRDKDRLIPRDNVLLELGMFIGALGRDRVFFVVPRDSPVHLPSDLRGVEPLTFDAQRRDGNLLAALGPACQQILRALSAPPAQVRRETEQPPAQPTVVTPTEADDTDSRVHRAMRHITAYVQQQQEYQRTLEAIAADPEGVGVRYPLGRLTSAQVLAQRELQFARLILTGQL